MADWTRSVAGRIAADNFDQPNGAIGGNWTPDRAGVWNYATNKARYTTSSGSVIEARLLYSADAARAATYCQIRALFSAADSAGLAALAADTSGYMCCFTTAEFQIYKRTAAGSYTKIAYLTAATTAGTERVLTISIEDGAQKAWFGSTLVSATDGTYTADRQAVIRSACKTGEYVDHNNFILTTGHSLTLTGIPAGHKVRLAGGTLQTPTAGTVTLEWGGYEWGLDRTFEVVDAGGTVVSSGSAGLCSAVDGGDTWDYGGPTGETAATSAISETLTLQDTIQFRQQLAGFDTSLDDFSADTLASYNRYGSTPGASLAISGGVLSVVNSSGAARTDYLSLGADLDFTQQWVSIDVASAGPNVVAAGIYKDGSNYVAAEWDRGANQIRIAVATTGSGWNGYANATPGGTPTKIGFNVVGGVATCWAYESGVWVRYGSYAFAGTVDLTTPANLVGWKPGFGVRTSGNGTWVLDNFTFGSYGGVGLRDPSIVVTEDGSPYVVDQELYLLLDVCDASSPSFYVGLFTLNLSTYALTAKGVLFFSRGGKTLNDLAGSLVINDDGSFEVFVSSWANYTVTGLGVYHAHVDASTDLLAGGRFVVAVSALTLPSSRAGTYDPFAFKVGDYWHLAYVATEDTASSVLSHPTLAYSADLSTWYLIAQLPTGEQREGTKLAAVDGRVHMLAATTSAYADYDLDLASLGTVDCPVPASVPVPPHPMVFQAGGATWLLTFDATLFQSLGGTYGKLKIYADGSPTFPPDPVMLTATAASATEIDLSWNADAKPTSYLVERSDDTSPLVYATLDTLGAGEDSYADTTCDPHTTYWYRVTASNSAGSESDEASATTLNTAPSAPGAFTTPATGVDYSGTIAISQAAATDADGDTLQYEYDYSANGGSSWSVLRALGTINPSWDTSGLSAGGNYKVRSRAHDGIDYGAYVTSGAFGVGDPPAEPTITADTHTPAMGRGVDLYGSSFSDPGAGTHAASQWQITTAADTGFAAPVYNPGSDATNLTSVEVRLTLTQSTAYIARVRYQSSTGLWSDWSDADSFTTGANRPPSVPSTWLSPEDDSSQTDAFVALLDISGVTDPDGDAIDHYDFRRRVNGGAWTDIGSSDSGAISVDLAGLAVGATVEVHARSSDGIEESAYGTALSVTVAAQPLVDRVERVVGQGVIIHSGPNATGGTWAATTYQIQIAGGDWSDLVWADIDNASPDISALCTALGTTDLYEVRLKQKDSLGVYTAWSAAFRFRIADDFSFFDATDPLFDWIGDKGSFDSVPCQGSYGGRVLRNLSAGKIRWTVGSASYFVLLRFRTHWRSSSNASKDWWLNGELSALNTFYLRFGEDPTGENGYFLAVDTYGRRVSCYRRLNGIDWNIQGSSAGLSVSSDGWCILWASFSVRTIHYWTYDPTYPGYGPVTLVERSELCTVVEGSGGKFTDTGWQQEGIPIGSGGSFWPSDMWTTQAVETAQPTWVSIDVPFASEGRLEFDYITVGGWPAPDSESTPVVTTPRLREVADTSLTVAGTASSPTVDLQYDAGDGVLVPLATVAVTDGAWSYAWNTSALTAGRGYRLCVTGVNDSYSPALETAPTYSQRFVIDHAETPASFFHDFTADAYGNWGGSAPAGWTSRWAGSAGDWDVRRPVDFNYSGDGSPNNCLVQHRYHGGYSALTWDAADGIVDGEIAISGRQHSAVFGSGLGLVGRASGTSGAANQVGYVAHEQAVRVAVANAFSANINTGNLVGFGPGVPHNRLLRLVGNRVELKVWPLDGDEDDAAYAVTALDARAPDAGAWGVETVSNWAAPDMFDAGVYWVGISDLTANPPPPPEPAEPSRPCTLLLTAYQADRETPDWQVSTDPSDAYDYLQEPTSYGGQSVDFAEGKASITQVQVSVIDPPVAAAPTDQDQGWLTQKLATDGRTAVLGRRHRLRRYIDTDLGWIDIADGPAAAPRLRPSFAGYEWGIRDTRESERKLRAFSGKTLVSCFPRGPLTNWGDKGDGTYLLPAVVPLDGVWKSAGYVDLTSYLTPSDHFNTSAVADDKIIYTDALGKAGEPTANYYVYDVDGVPWYRHEYGNVTVQWSEDGGTTWNTMPSLFYDSDQLVGTNMFLQWAAVHKDDDGNTVYAVDYLGTFRVLGTYSDDGTTLLTPLADNTSIKLRVLYSGEISADYPLYIEDTLGALLKDLYDGVYTPDANGDPTQTGIRYDAAALAALTQPVLLRITEAVDNLREWTETNCYAPAGYAPALDNSLRISPVSQSPPNSTAGLISLTNAITQPTATWQHGDRVVNVIKFTYRRFYPLASESDGIGVREVTQEYRDEESIDTHGEQELTIDTQAFGAVGDINGAAIGEEEGALLAAERYAVVFPRWLWGTPTATLRCFRTQTYSLRAGSFALATPTWMPNYPTQMRGMSALVQVLEARDLSCAWREFVVEVVPLARQAAVAIGGGGGLAFTTTQG